MNRDEIHVIVRESKRVTICAKSEFRITNTDTDQMKKTFGTSESYHLSKSVLNCVSTRCTCAGLSKIILSNRVSVITLRRLVEPKLSFSRHCLYIEIKLRSYVHIDTK